jgi:uncharacterized membrane protein
MSIKEAFLKSNIQAVIALIVVVGGFAFLAFVPATEGTQATIGNFIMLVLGYYFGSSRSSARKDEMMNQNNQTP